MDFWVVAKDGPDKYLSMVQDKEGRVGSGSGRTAEEAIKDALEHRKHEAMKSPPPAPKLRRPSVKF